MWCLHVKTFACLRAKRLSGLAGGDGEMICLPHSWHMSWDVMGFECFWLRLCLKLQRVWSPAQPEQYQNMSHIFCGLATNTLKLSTRERIPQYVHTGIYSSMFQIAYRPVTSDSANVSLRQHLPWTAALTNIQIEWISLFKGLSVKGSNNCKGIFVVIQHV